VIGLPGETVEIHGQRVTIDGRPLPLRGLPPEDFAWVPAKHRMAHTVYDEDGHWAAFTPGGGLYPDLAPLRLQAGEYFLLGDSRDTSLDCRAWGPLNEDAILGKVILRIATGPRN
jgi:signal peptidase I